MLGVHCTVSPEQERELFAMADSGRIGEIVEHMDARWDPPAFSVDTDKAWDAIHRCLTEGTLHPDDGAYPLSHAVLGGRHLHDEYYVVHVTAAEVVDLAAALRGVERDRLRDRYDALVATDYDGPHGDEDFEYTWQNLTELREFYVRAAEARLAVVFTAA